MLKPLDETILRELFSALAENEVQYILVGGIAMQVHDLSRTTEDIDLFVAPGEENVRRLRAALDAVFHDPELEEITAADFAGEYGVVRYGPPEHDFVVDLLSRIGEMFQYGDLGWEERLFQGVRVRVANAETLVRMKHQTMRDKDHRDAAPAREVWADGELRCR